MLPMLRMHVGAATKVIQTLNLLELVRELAELTPGNFTTFATSNESHKPQTAVDGVHLYATELLSLGLIWHGFHDVVCAGDGERILRYWKFLLVLLQEH